MALVKEVFWVSSHPFCPVVGDHTLCKAVYLCLCHSLVEVVVNVVCPNLSCKVVGLSCHNHRNDLGLAKETYPSPFYLYPCQNLCLSCRSPYENYLSEVRVGSLVGKKRKSICHVHQVLGVPDAWVDGLGVAQMLDEEVDLPWLWSSWKKARYPHNVDDVNNNAPCLARCLLAALPFHHHLHHSFSLLGITRLRYYWKLENHGFTYPGVVFICRSKPP